MRTAGGCRAAIEQALFRVDFESGDVAQFDSVRTYEAIVVPFLVAKDVRIPAGSYDYTVSRASYTFGSQRKVSGTASHALRQLLRRRPARAELAQPDRVLAADLRRADDHLERRSTGRGAKGHNNLVSSRLTYTVSPRMFLSALVQYQSRTDSVSTNARFRWEYRPGSELFVVYNDGRTTLTRGIPDIQNRSFVVKVTRLFQL